jgi:hypothetical protein
VVQDRVGLTRSEIAAWCAAVVVASAAVAAVGYGTPDPDSRLYAEMAATLSRRPIRSWIAPEWPPGLYMRGLYQEHPAGLFVPAAILARLGYPADQAAYALGLAYSALAFALVPWVAAVFAPAEARTLGWLLQLLPIFFVFRVRANHEPALLALFFVALLATEALIRSRRGALPLLIAALAALMVVKGFLVVPATVCCALWLLVRSRESGTAARPRWIVSALAVAGGLIAVVLAYEWAYRATTGESFLAAYARRSLVVGHSWSILTIPYNLLFYSGRVVWFAFPWSLVLVGAVLRYRPQGREAPSLTRGLSTGVQGLLFVLGAAAIYLGVFSLSGRRAERYIYPVYPLVGAAGAVVALRRWPALGRICARLRPLEPMAPALTWLLLVGLHLVGGYLHLPRIKVWNP